MFYICFRELDLTNTSRINQRPPPEHIENAFYKEKKLAAWGSLSFTFILIVVWPTISAVLGRFSSLMFTIWVSIVLLMALLGFIYLIIAPMYVEVSSIVRQYKENKKKTSDNVFLTLNDNDKNAKEI